MPSHGSSSPNHQQRTKRQRQSSHESAPDCNSHQSPSHQSPSNQFASDAVLQKGTNATGKAGQGNNFRNVSACNRCRLRKNRCDQKLPSCASCAKAGVACVGYDPITKKEIPRSYVFYLETRVEQLEKLLTNNNIQFPAAENLELCSRPSVEARSTKSTATARCSECRSETNNGASAKQHQASEELKVKRASQSPAQANIINRSKTRSLASASGVSFARVVVAAVQHSVSEQTDTNERAASRKANAGASMRDSFFGLHTRPTIQPVPFPEKAEGMRLATLYFEHANPQIPILHRVDFMQTFDKAYGSGAAQGLTAQELYMMNMVFAIGSGVILGEPIKTSASVHPGLSLNRSKSTCQPEEYHASAAVHLEECLSTNDGYLEVLQAVLLLANFALLRPVPPGLWYITGVAVRLAVDLGLHHEDVLDVEVEVVPPETSAGSRGTSQASQMREDSAQDRGRRLWIRDLRRRLWWCTYTFDRLVSTCVGRPFGVSDEIITTELPSLLDDEFITRRGFEEPPDGVHHPSYKRVAHHYFRLRLLQSEILQVLQYNQAQLARATNRSPDKIYSELRPHLPCPFLVQFDSFRSWRMDVDGRLFRWKTSAPTREETGVAFATEFFELNYWQAIILLYRQSLSVPAVFEGEYNPSDEVNSPSAFTAELGEDEDYVCLKVAEAGQKILRIYRQLHLGGLVSYTYLSTHHLFMAGISYLYAIWHSALVRSRLTMDEVDFTVLAAKSVFSDMMEKCPPAETCRDAFDRTARATMKMASSNGGFGAPFPQPRRQGRGTTSCTTVYDGALLVQTPTRHRHRPSEQAVFHVDASLSDGLSTPELSAAGERTVPGQKVSLATKEKALKSDTITSGQSRSARSGLSPRDRMSQDDASSIDPSLVPSPHGPLTAPFTGQQFGFQDFRRFPDAHKMEFLHSLEAGPSGELSSADHENGDIGFGLNWDGLHNDVREGQHIDPFDTFFFGGQQGSGHAGHRSGNYH
ncbi:hypothetical protein E4U43_001929 [Claviceps pusilla]|uniref:Zn(2)-C6 fungal-type domain-containing protein n=1 Tax=Claviceps pusilla TaxID=123648 RepID=A0A9P7N886_9HYPO|nr:hypothetical protein E4U43_001929 [Claviceps pusilla]